MNHSAQVNSIDGVIRFRAAFREFQDQAQHALVALDEQILRAQQWLEHDGPIFWKAQIRRCYDDVARTRASLETAKMRSVGDHRPACIEEQEAYRAAQRRLREAEEKIETLRRWAQRVREEFDDYRGRTRGFRDAVESGVPRSVALLDRTIRSLEAYVERPEPGTAQAVDSKSTPQPESTASADPASPFSSTPTSNSSAEA